MNPNEWLRISDSVSIMIMLTGIVIVLAYIAFFKDTSKKPSKNK